MVTGVSDVVTLSLETGYPGGFRSVERVSFRTGDEIVVLVKLR